MKALGKVGSKIGRQKGSHVILVKGDRVVPVPRHAEIKGGSMEIITEAGLTKEEFLRLL